ncbi:MAG: DsrE/DsrF/DrsH-like family protein [Candidatus Ozemobacteraceae bacterium]
MNDDLNTTVESRLLEKIKSLEEKVGLLSDQVKEQKRDDAVCLVCFSGDWDKLFAAFTIATGALSLGQEVHMFFTFWGISALRSPESTGEKSPKNLVQKMLGSMLADSPQTTPLSKLHFGGISKILLGQLMKEKGVEGLDSLINQAHELGAKFYLCDTSANLFGFGSQELKNGSELNTCGVATFLSKALKSKVVLFI